jgi:hypothetical protein
MRLGKNPELTIRGGLKIGRRPKVVEFDRNEFANPGRDARKAFDPICEPPTREFTVFEPRKAEPPTGRLPNRPPPRLVNT